MYNNTNYKNMNINEEINYYEDESKYLLSIIINYDNDKCNLCIDGNTNCIDSYKCERCKYLEDVYKQYNSCNMHLQLLYCLL